MCGITHQEVFVPASRPTPGCLPEIHLVPHWFAVYTSPRHEKRVDQQLKQRGVECYLPLYHPKRKWTDGSRVTLDLPLFPGYIFVFIRRTERVKVLAAPDVLAIVGSTGREPVWLPETEINALRSGLHLRCAEPYPFLAAGQRARIVSGALSGMEGIVLRNKNGLRIVLTRDLIRQSLSVEVDAREVEQLDSGFIGCNEVRIA